MKRALIFALVGIALAAGSFAQSMMDEPRSVDAIVADIEQQQGVDSPDQIKPDTVKPALVEELGDAVMGVIIGNSDMHDAMDKMLGGDGSPRLSAFHTDLGEQYLRNGGLDGVRMGGPWGMGRLGMMYGWGRLGQAPNQIKTIEGKLAFLDGNPAIETAQGTYVLGFPNFYYYAYTDKIAKGTKLKLEGYLFAEGQARANPYFAVSRATIGNKVYDFSGFGRGMMGGGGMMGGFRPGMMGGPGAGR